MNYAKINLFDIANGKGIRVSLFVSGCKFHCKDCFNEQAQNFNYGKPYTSKEQDLITSRLLDNDNFQGLSILGGDPMWQSKEDLERLSSLCGFIHTFGKDVWLWTGFTWEEIFEGKDEEALARQKLISNCDVVIDGRFEIEKKNLGKEWCGSTNQRVIDVQKTLKTGEIILYK